MRIQIFGDGADRSGVESSIRKPAAWARETVRRDLRAWYRRHWTIFPVFGASVVVVVLLNAALALPPFVAGLYDGVLATTMVGIALLAGIIGSGSHSRLLGVAGESFTAEEFTRRKRRHQGWRVFNGIKINGHEIDHIAVGPGGVLAIETKFVGSGSWRVTPAGLEGALCDPLRQARMSRDKTLSILRSLKRSLPAIDDVGVLAVLIVWGPGCPALPDGHVALEGVELFSGQHETQWRDWLDGPRLDYELVEALGAAMSSFDAAHTPATADLAHAR